MSRAKFALELTIVCLLGHELCTDATGSSVTKNETHFTYWCVGSCEEDAKPKSTEPGIILMGGGTDTDDAFKQHILWSGSGDFLVLRASGDDAYNPYIRALAETHSVATLLTKDKRAASDSRVLAIVDRADAIFFAGGDQWTYLQEWQGTPLQQHVQAAINERGVPVGGTSAGCDVQGGAIYTAAQDSVVSDEALADPFNFRVTVQRRPFLNHTTGTPPHAPLPSPHAAAAQTSAGSVPTWNRTELLLSTAIIDTHFVTRDRMGRLVAFLARLRSDLRRPDAVAIGIDEQTAIAIDRSGNGTLLRQSEDGGRAFVLTPAAGVSPKTCEQGKELEFADIPVQKLDAAYGDSYNFAAMTGGAASQSYTISAKKGKLTPSDPYSPLKDKRAQAAAGHILRRP